MSSFASPWSLLFLVNAIYSVDCQTKIGIVYYDIDRFDSVVSFNGSNLTTTSDSCTLKSPRLECEPGSKLDDDITGPTGNSVSDDIGSFFAFSLQSEQNGVLHYTFGALTPNLSIVVYFFNQPNQSIGLPAFSITQPDLSFTFGNNSDLSQTDSSVKSVILHLMPRSEINLLSISISFDDTTNIDWFLVSEIQFIQNEPSFPSVLESIVFQDGPLSVISIGPSNPWSSVAISCTVVNSGSFVWTWKYNEVLITSSEARYQILMVDATRTSILMINESRYSDSGNYTCSVRHEGDTVMSDRNNQLELNDGLIAEPSNVSATINKTAFLKCELYGYLSVANAIIKWTKNGQDITAGGRYVLINSGGSFDSINSNGLPRTDSIVTELEIKSLQESDNGVYVCLSGNRAVEVTLDVTAAPIVESSSTTLFSSVQLSPSLLQSTTTTAATTTTTSTALTQSSSSSTQISNQNSPSLQSSQVVTMSSLPSQNNDSSAYVIVGAVVAIVIVIVLINFGIILMIALTCHFKQRSLENIRPVVIDKATVQTEMEPFYSEINKKPNKYTVITPYSETEILSEGSNGLVRVTSTGQNYEMPEYSEIPEIPVRPAHIFPSSPPKAVNPTLLKENPMYASSNDLEFSCKYGGSAFNIYAEPNIPPPIPDYDGTPVPSIYNASIYSVDLRPSDFQSQENLNREDDSVSPYLQPCTSIYSDPEPIIKSDVLEVTENQISEIKELGMGQFGRVILAHTIGISLKELKLSTDESSISILVAVKRLSEDSDEKDRQAFEKEIKFMARLRHENVVRLLGICLDRNAFIMMEYMENGDLSQYLQKFDFTPETTSPGYLSVAVLVYMCVQVAAGMRYLASLSFVHRDLAARNCLVGQKYIIKIADFGMSRKLYDRNYYRIQGKAVLPIRWMSSECFYGRFSEKTDVWAFGVTMWEIFNFCRLQPYDEFDDQEVINNAIKGQDTVLLEQPHTSPEDIYHIMTKCWHHVPESRPTFENLHGYLSQMHAYSDLA